MPKKKSAQNTINQDGLALYILEHAQRLFNIERNENKITSSFNDLFIGCQKGLSELAAKIEAQDRRIAELEKLLMKTKDENKALAESLDDDVKEDDYI